MFALLGIALVVVTVVAAVVGVAAGTDQLWASYRKRVPDVLGWRAIEQGTRNLIAQLRADNYVPDVVVAIGRSGAILGGLLAGNMHNLPMALLDRHFSWDHHRRDFIQSGFSEVHLSDDCKQVLVVVGEVYSGQTLIECLNSLGPVLVGKTVRTCTLIKSKTSTCHVDYVAMEVEKVVRPAWVMTSDYARAEIDSRIPKR
jgi:hypoxanthine phosphoribosyltransferase